MYSKMVKNFMTATPIKISFFEPLNKNLFLSFLQVFGASLLLALFSQICIPFEFSPIPLTGQTFGMMLIGATMGSRKALFSVIIYVIEGALGCPFFAGGSSGLICLLCPSGGYIWGFIFQAYFVGRFTERLISFRGIKVLFILLLSSSLQLGLGVLWFSFFVGFGTAIILGLLPFLLGEIMKSIVLTLYLKKHNQ